MTYEGCSLGGEVELYRIEGMGYQWPGSELDTGLGTPNDELDATRIIWRFFERYRLR